MIAPFEQIYWRSHGRSGIGGCLCMRVRYVETQRLKMSDFSLNILDQWASPQKERVATATNETAQQCGV